MKRVISIILPSILLIIQLYSQEIPQLITGGLLFIQPTEPCTVFLDGEEVGPAPLFLSNITPRSTKMELKSESGYKEITLSFDSSITRVTNWSPSLEPYYGYINLEINKANASVYINGTKIDMVEDRLKYKAGTYTLHIEKEGYFPETREIAIERLTTTNEVIVLQSAIQVRFDPAIPEGSYISCLQKGTGTHVELTASTKTESITLSPGTWDISLENPSFMKNTQTLSLENPVEIMQWKADNYTPGFRMLSLKENSKIFLDDEPVFLTDESNVVYSTVGIHELEIHTKGYLPYRTQLKLEGNALVNIEPSYKKDPEHIARRKTNTGFVLIGSGITLLAGGILLNNDSVLVPYSTDYSSYTTMKYATLGIAGMGAAAIVTGGSLSLPELLSKNNSGE